ncbi:MAG: WhiB family transcriptional regulator [Mycolicibacterium sp.]|nr:WhiB family transcriptional regulator [Mycolicibacterium sp.]
MTSPTPATAPSGPPRRRLACQNDPERWFDPEQRTAALAACLHCPARPWCARQALQQRASWGMWAGIWIDDDLGQVAYYLRAIAAGPGAPRRLRSMSPPSTAALATQPSPRRGEDNAWVRAAVTARSSGHCEIMPAGCRYSGDKIASRVIGLAPHDADTASLLYIVCGACEMTLERIEHPIARRLGYRIDGAQLPGRVPFYWRQHRWVLLEPSGRLRDSAAEPSRPSTPAIAPLPPRAHRSRLIGTA